MADKTYIVAVVGVIKKNGVMANAGEEVTSDNFDNFDDRIKGGYVIEKSDYEKVKDQADKDQALAAEKADRDDSIIAYKKAFKVDAPADAETKDIQKAIADKVQINKA